MNPEDIAKLITEDPDTSEADAIYATIESDLWKEAGRKYPDYNSDPGQTSEATEYMLKKLEKKHGRFAHTLRKALFDKIHSGMT